MQAVHHHIHDPSLTLDVWVLLLATVMLGLTCLSLARLAKAVLVAIGCYLQLPLPPYLNLHPCVRPKLAKSLTRMKVTLPWLKWTSLLWTMKGPRIYFSAAATLCIHATLTQIRVSGGSAPLSYPLSVFQSCPQVYLSFRRNIALATGHHAG